MAKLKLSKSALSQQRTQLQLYGKLLPSLDLKRRQLTVEREKARQEKDRSRAAVDELERTIGGELPMVANTDLDLRGLVRMTGFELGQENVVGVRLPVLERIECEVAEYSLLARPAWVDVLVQRLKDAAEQRMRVRVATERVRILEQAVRRTTQRVNLFERILIPEAKRNIQRIQIFLGDQDRDAVVRSKLAKGRHGGPAANAESIGGGQAS